MAAPATLLEQLLAADRVTGGGVGVADRVAAGCEEEAGDESEERERADLHGTPTQSG